MQIDAATRVIYHNPAIQAARVMATYASATSALHTDLVSWWTLNEASGSRADSHGSNTLTDNNTVGSAAGKRGNAASFGGVTTGEHLSIASNSALQMGGTDFSIALWCNADIVSGTEGGWLINKRDASTNDEYQISVYPPSFGGFRFQAFPSGGAVLATSNITSVSLSTWYFIVAEYDTAGATAQIYVNNTAGTSGTGSGTISSGTAGMAIGTQAWNTGNGEWDGLVDEVAIWKRLLTSDEKTWLYNSGNGRTYSDLASYS